VSFNSAEFALFLGVVLAVHWGVRPRWRNHVVLGASAVFYGWWDVRFLTLLGASIVVDHVLAGALHRTAAEGRRRLLLGVSLLTNLGLLAVFKYAGFFADSLATALGGLGLEANPVLLDVVLPVGISFYTFQTISYTFDVYRRRMAPAADLLTFATYVAWFPQLVAGPIERAQRLLPLIADVDRRFPRGVALERALSLIVLGLVKKVVLADGVAGVVSSAFDDPGSASWIALVAGAVGFSVQIYGDFSGYSDIARGVSLLLGVDLMTNFREPYLSRSITEFWQRWHISLSTWLRDYLYVPLGGNRGSRGRTMANLMVTMLLGGLWHGAAWTFVVWGGLHGLYLALERALGVGARRPGRAPAGVTAGVTAGAVARTVWTASLVTLTWVPFRADSLGSAATYVGGILRGQAGAWSAADVATVALLGGLLVAIDLGQRAQAARPEPLVRRPLAAGAILGLAAVGLLVFSGGTPEPFIYFQF
jgi:alginate O-acetyltransferase complex protein AlgI